MKASLGTKTPFAVLQGTSIFQEGAFTYSRGASIFVAAAQVMSLDYLALEAREASLIWFSPERSLYTILLPQFL